MKRKLAVIGLCLAGMIQAQDPSLQVTQVSKTEHVDFPAGGTLRLDKSIGELTIEGWDQPGIEITTTKSTKDIFTPKDREKELKDLDSVRVSTKLNGSELVVNTEFPHHKSFPWVSPVSDTTDFDLEYRIMVPRNTRIVVKHNAGEVHFAGLTGNIEATVPQGLISLWLTGDTTRSIDAKSRIGSVTSDYPGTVTRHPWPLGHEVTEAPSTTAQNLHLRVGYGDIIIRKAFTLPSPGSQWDVNGITGGPVAPREQ
jgi:hypothetical protein